MIHIIFLGSIFVLLGLIVVVSAILLYSEIQYRFLIKDLKKSEHNKVASNQD